MHPKISFLFTSLYKRLLNIDMNCPSCGGAGSKAYDQKYNIILLRRCQKCSLLYRAPTSSDEDNQQYYQQEYKQGFTTELPTIVQLQNLIASGFIGSERDHSDKINVLEALGGKKGDHVFDFGCSWGYGSWQLKQRGFLVTGFDISKLRAEYAHKYLNVNIYTTLSDLTKSNDSFGKYDIFFSSHVLEHVPSVSAVLDLAFHLLKPNGLIVLFTPNGSLACKIADPIGWHNYWGFVHINFLDDIFYNKTFANVPRLMATYPYDMNAIRSTVLKKDPNSTLPLNGYELMLAARKESCLISNWIS